MTVKRAKDSKFELMDNSGKQSFKCLLDASFNIISIEQMPKASMSISKKPKLGQPIWELFKGVGREDLEPFFYQTLLTGLPVYFKTKFNSAQHYLCWHCFELKKQIHLVVVQHSKKEAKQEVSDLLLNTLYTNTSEGIIYIDNNFRVISANNLAISDTKEYAGKKLIVGHDVREVFIGDLREIMISSIMKAFEGKKEVKEFEIMHRSEKKWFELTITPVFIKRNEVIGVLIIVKNIHKIRSAELAMIENNKKLSQNETILQAFLENTNDAIAVIGLNYKIIALNDIMRYFTITYFEHEMSIGEDYRQYVGSDVMKDFLMNFKKAKQGITTYKDVFVKGKEVGFWFQFKLSPVYNTKGDLLGVALTGQNINDRKTFELALKKSEEKFRNIIENAAIPMLIIDLHLKIVLANKEAENLLGYSREEMYLKDVQDLFFLNRNRYNKQNQENINFDLKDGQTKMYTKNHDLIYVNAQLNEMDVDEEIFGIISLQNITSQLKNDIQLKKINHELSLLTKSNDVILKAHSEQSLFRNICQTSIKYGAYQLVWICLKEEEAEFVRPIEAAGVIDYLKGLKVSLTIKKYAQGPTAMALLHGKTTVINNVSKAKNFKPWLSRAKKFGIAASCSIPIKLNNRNIGAINFYASTENAFDKNEVNVLERIANNVSLAINNIRTGNEKLNSLMQLNERVKELNIIYQINTLLKDESLNFEHALLASVDIIPSGWKYSEHCKVSIQFHDQQFQSKHKGSIKSKQEAKRLTDDGKELSLVVGYTKLFPEADEGPFLKEEKEVLETIVELLSMTYNKRAAYQALINSENNLKSVIENTNVGHLLLDTNYHILLFSQALGQAFYLMRGIELKLNQALFDFINDDQKIVFQKLLEQVKQSKQEISYDLNYEIEGSMNYFSSTIVPVMENEQVTGYSISIYDVTKIKVLEIEREKIINDLLQRNRDLEQFSYIISHNIRSPLATLLGFSALLKNELSSKDKEIILNGMQESSAKLDNTIRDVNEILNIKKELLKSKTEIDLNKIIHTVLETLEENIKSSGAQIHYNFSKAPSLLSISPYLHSIFYNLISNGIKYAKRNEAPQITIWSDKNDSNLYIYVTDNGKGIDLEKYGDQLFGLYKKFNHEVEGKGMGLFMVKKQIEALNGSIDVQSKIDEGTTFTIRIPIL